MNVQRESNLPTFSRNFIRRIQERAAFEGKKSGREIIVLSERRLSTSIGRIDSRNPYSFFLYLNDPAIKIFGLTKKNNSFHEELLLEEYIFAQVRLAGSIYKQMHRSYLEWLAACFLAVRQEEKGYIDLSYPGISVMVMHDNNRDWQIDQLYCELQAMDVTLHSLFEDYSFTETETNISWSTTDLSRTFDIACSTGNIISEEVLSLIRQRDMLAVFSDMPEIIYDCKGMPHLAVCWLLNLLENLQRKRSHLPERYPVIRTLCIFIQELEKECPDMGYAGDSYKKELIARWLFLNQFEANMANVRKDTLDDLTKAITTYENRAVFYIQKSIKYNNRAFRDNQVAISRTLIGAEAVRVNLPYEITGSKVHPLGYW